MEKAKSNPVWGQFTSRRPFWDIQLAGQVPGFKSLKAFAFGMKFPAIAFQKKKKFTKTFLNKIKKLILAFKGPQLSLARASVLYGNALHRAKKAEGLERSFDPGIQISAGPSYCPHGVVRSIISAFRVFGKFNICPDGKDSRRRGFKSRWGQSFLSFSEINAISDKFIY